eukprot:TRINITY_DN4585_c0_g1_i1.p1 TRINITY_DN4585_c0_g1~~TRINITY_DN4585_c0_g1_i1.p1  ORF type:complete len:181 (-),score=51.30 TRINITY_DN4585_c0_g1_i1:125-667(-)
MVAIYGPMEVQRQTKELIDRAYIEVIYKPRSGIASPADKEKEKYIKNCVEAAILSTLHPRTEISIVVQVLNEDGSIVSTAVNAACLALIDAGIPMKNMIAATTIAYLDGDLILDPTEKEEKESSSIFTFAIHSQSDGTLAVRTKGFFSEDEFNHASEASQGACERVFSFLRRSLEKKYAE